MERQILDKSYWLEKREIVKNSYVINENWIEIIQNFRKRIEDFYFTPIDIIKEPKKLNGEGFTILTIQCALIEMFSAFKYGKIHKYNKRGDLPNFEYKKADECFIPFLQTESIFANHFYKIENNQTIINQPFSAVEFYNQVRCGLMHEARTKGNWVINSKKTYTENEITFISNDIEKNKIRIDRTILNKLLKKYFLEYLNNLLENTIEGNQLRRLFARKLDHLYDIPTDSENFDWWIDN